VRVRAADWVLGQGAKAIEIEDIEATVSELKRAAAAIQASAVIIMKPISTRVGKLE